jgi:hypothetical protein
VTPTTADRRTQPAGLLTAIADNIYMSAVRSGMVAVVPLTIAGGLFMSLFAVECHRQAVRERAMDDAAHRWAISGDRRGLARSGLGHPVDRVGDGGVFSVCESGRASAGGGQGLGGRGQGLD